MIFLGFTPESSASTFFVVIYSPENMRNVAQFEAFSEAGFSCAFYRPQDCNKCIETNTWIFIHHRTDNILKDIF